jgi:hypothetical protein
VSADTGAPTQIFHRVIDALLASVAYTLHGVSSYGTHACGLVARTHVYWIRSVPKVEAASKLALLERADLVAGRCWEAETRRGHGFGDGLEGDCWVSECKR